MFYPLIQAVPYLDPLDVFAHFSQQAAPKVFFDSAQIREHCGRYSFIAIGPFLTLTSKNGFVTVNGKTTAADPWKLLAHYLQSFSCLTNPTRPGFQGGVAGFFSYDLFRHLESTLKVNQDEMAFPDMALGFYDVVLGFDRVLNEAWVVSNGSPLQGKEREQRALHRMHQMVRTLERVRPAAPFNETKIAAHAIQANFSSETYQVAVKTVIDYILAGDIFEANISQRFKTQLPEPLTPFDLYRRLRLLNPAPFAGFAQFDNTVIASASPERFLKLSQGKVEARPIKGTRPRGTTQAQDEKWAAELLQSEKDHAENVMIVDLLRNDLSRVCADHSVKVPQLCGLESYATVHHLVSVIQGELAAPYGAVDLLCASFPGGSITGAPKKRAIEIITEIEPTCRGPYCGSLGYIGFNGDMDTSILIRSFVIKDRTITFQAGGAIVIGSCPREEYEETLTKAKALREALVL